MRRIDKEILDRGLLDRIIHDSAYCHLACCLRDKPYVIPVSFGYDGEAVYIHTASAGKKIDYIGENPHVCLSFVQRANLISDPDKACDWSYDFTSAIAEGIITEIIDADGKTRAINQIMSHYSGREWDIPEKSLAGTRVWKITLYKLNGKRSPPP